MFSKHFVANLLQIRLLIIINRDKNHTVVREQISREPQPRVNHRAPFRVEARVGFVVDLHAVAVLIDMAAFLFVFVEALLEVVIVDEVIPRIIRRIDVNHLDLAEVAFLQQLERVEVVALDVEVLRRVPVLAFFFDRAQRFLDGRVRLDKGGLFAYPGEFIRFLALADVVVQELLELVKIDRVRQIIVAYPPPRPIVSPPRTPARASQALQRAPARRTAFPFSVFPCAILLFRSLRRFPCYRWSLSLGMPC